jgi:hypothetical protein
MFQKLLIESVFYYKNIFIFKKLNSFQQMASLTPISIIITITRNTCGQRE